jgi:tRNA nucleotidyltransferase (CCA-adding enzyme)
VGADFPVFLHPHTHEEHALARTERKSGVGYRGFEVHADPSVTLEEDLARRDFTVNAMALSEHGDLIDPWGGQADLEARLLRHVSPAFSEDPLRVLRAARLLAQLAEFNFTLAAQTRTLIQDMVASGELSALTPERVWQEMAKGLRSTHPALFFTSLREWGALKVILPEFDALFGVPQTQAYHPEVDAGQHALKALTRAAALTDRLDVRYSVLCHDVGKALTPSPQLPGHRGHDHRGVAVVDQISARLRVSQTLAQLARLTCRWHMVCHTLPEAEPEEVLAMLQAFKPQTQPNALIGFGLACRADVQGRSGWSTLPYPQADWLLPLAQRMLSVRPQRLPNPPEPGPALGAALQAERLKVISAALAELQRGQSLEPLAD